MVGSRWLILVAAISGCLCVGIGAMGSHSLPKSLEKQGFSDVEVAKKINQCEIAVKYQMFHTLVLLAIGFAPAAGFRGGWRATCLLFIVGMLLFSGGLYSMVFWDRMGHWSIVPLGGSLLMIAWLSLAFNAFFLDKSSVGTGIPNG
ncbi:MAG: DUF423 domain-containing protein [Pirellula sp.]|jgi:uncharacterized membrane protein YgdD (TMEM256/DUF423 family)|nr:DUF423 domain-containing protein [Pirellula sp.]